MLGDDNDSINQGAQMPPSKWKAAWCHTQLESENQWTEF